MQNQLPFANATGLGYQPHFKMAPHALGHMGLTRSFAVKRCGWNRKIMGKSSLIIALLLGAKKSPLQVVLMQL
jgi:hypothetical protein